MKRISPPKFKTRSPTPFVIGEILNGCECHPFSEIETKTRHVDMVRADVYINYKIGRVDLVATDTNHKSEVCMQDVKSLTDAGDFGSFGRYEEVPVSKMAPEMKGAYDYTMQLRGIVPGPHKIWLANATLSRTIVPIGAYYQKQSTLTKAEIEIVTVLTNARWHSAYGTYEHEKIADKLGHIPAETTEHLIVGLPTEFSDTRQQVVYELASALVQPRIVPVGLYKRAKEALGDAGLVDVAVLIGWFTMVSMTLNAYDVPANATGLDQ